MGNLKLLAWRLCVLAFCVQLAESAKIVLYINIASYSHRVVTYPLADALAKRGHNVTFISPFKHRGPYINPNVTEIVPKKLASTMQAFISSGFDINFRIQKTMASNVQAFFPSAIEACKDLLESDEFQSFVDQTKTIDLLILDDCMTECGMFMKHKYRAKHIFFNTIVFQSYEYDIYGFNPESSSVPEEDVWSPPVPMSFLERVKNTLKIIHFRYVHYFHYMPEVDWMIRQYPGFQDMPFVDDLFRNTSLVLSMGDMVADYPCSLPPLIVNVGGLHCQQGRDPLPEELGKFVEDHSEGFVYISFGSMIEPSNLPKEIREVFFKAMEKFQRLKFLWKWNGPLPEKDETPKNLFLGKWFPQKDLLAHPKIKAFVTQSGRPSIYEAVCAGVPMIAFPVMGDQDANANRINQMGGNVILDFGNLTVPGLVATIQKVISKETRQRMERLKNIHEDQPMSPLDTAVWWTEYVLRHPDTQHLKPSGFSQWWFQRRLIDVWAFIFSIGLALIVVIMKLLIFIRKSILYIKMKLFMNSNKKVN